MACFVDVFAAAFAAAAVDNGRILADLFDPIHCDARLQGYAC